MTGRTGYLVILLFIFIASYFMMPKRFRLLSIIAPVILGFILIVFPTRFQSRFNDVIIDVQNYQPSESEHGNASRIDYWYYSIKPFTEKPLLGNGVGSWRQNYKLAGGLDKNPPSNPHQQYLLWAVESGTVGLLMIIIIFVSLIKDAFELQKIERQALITVTAIAALTGLINCPFFGVGMGEFFLT
jgi:O-antigen ligase